MTLEWCYQKVWFTTAEDIPESYLQQEVSGVPDLIWGTGCPFEVLLKAFVELCSQRNLFHLKTLQVPVQLASLAEIFLKYILTFNFVRLFVNPTCSPVENFMQLLEETCNKQCVSGLNITKLQTCRSCQADSSPHQSFYTACVIKLCDDRRGPFLVKRAI